MERIHWTRLNHALIKYGKDISQLMKNKLKQDNKISTGRLIQSINPYLEIDDSKYYLYIEMEKYGQYVDSGRKPGSKWPPRESIRKWIDDKGIRTKNKNALSFLIQRKIGVRGIEPHKFLDIWYKGTTKLNDIIEKSSKEDIEKNINNFIKKINEK